MLNIGILFPLPPREGRFLPKTCFRAKSGEWHIPATSLFIVGLVNPTYIAIPLPPKRISASERCVNSTSPLPLSLQRRGNSGLYKSRQYKDIKNFLNT